MRPILWHLTVSVVAALLLLVGSAHARSRASDEQATQIFLLTLAQEYRAALKSQWTGSNYCSWSGVTCDASGDVHVNLRGRGLVGTLPQLRRIGDSPTLVVSLDLSNNPGLSGRFQSDWRRLTELRVLNLSYTSLRGEIPDEWRRMSRLEEVYIHHTAACRSLPQWRDMVSLRVVDLSYNNFQGSLRSEWSQLPRLQSLNLAGNAFCGCVPSRWNSNPVLMKSVEDVAGLDPLTCFWDRCTSRSVCPLLPNPGSGDSGSATPPQPSPPQPAPPQPAPPAVDEDAAATLAFLSGLAAAFPSQLSTWTGADYCAWSGVTCDASGDVHVDLRGRGLVGTLPQLRRNGDSPTRVVSLDLSNNPGLSGHLVDSWAALKGLLSLRLSQTSLSGFVPESWNGLTSLQMVDLSDTKVCGGLPNWGIEMVSLREVRLSRTSMRGVLASSWARLPSLESVDLSGNTFCGCVPPSWVGNAVLEAAASSAGGDLTSPTCFTSNVCTGGSYLCY